MNTVLKTAAMAAMLSLGSLAVAQATPLSGTFTINVYQGLGAGGGNDPTQQALNTNPLIAPGNLYAVATYTGALNFNMPVGGDNTVGSFLASGGGAVTGLGAAASRLLSYPSYSLTTVFWIFGTTPAPISGIVSHDDGVTIYQGGVAVSSSPLPTVEIPTAYALNAGAFNLVYVEANGLPANLVVDVSRTAVPEPASMALLGGGLLGMGFLRRRRAV